jgi:hypothetical protein
VRFQPCNFRLCIGELGFERDLFGFCAHVDEIFCPGGSVNGLLVVPLFLSYRPVFRAIREGLFDV